MGFLSSLFGGKPTVPVMPSVSLSGSQQEALQSNQSILPGAEKLATGVSMFNQNQLNTLLNNVLPGFTANSDQTQKNISSMLKGELPADVSAAVQDSAAAKALTGGFGGSGLAGNLTARDLGLTSLNLMQQGQSAEQSWTSLIDQMFAPGLGNATSMFISPEQMFTSTMANNQSQWQQQWQQSQENAAPSSIVGGLFNTGLGLVKGVSSFLSQGGFGGGQPAASDSMFAPNGVYLG